METLQRYSDLNLDCIQWYLDEPTLEESIVIEQSEKQYRQGFVDSVDEALSWDDFILSVDPMDKAEGSRRVAKDKNKDNPDLKNAPEMAYNRGRFQSFSSMESAFIGFTCNGSYMDAAFLGFPYNTSPDQWEQFKTDYLLEYHKQVKKWIQMNSTEPLSPPRLPDIYKRARAAVKEVEAQQTVFRPKLITTCLADVEEEGVKWLWDNRIPSGALSLLAGNPGVGKTFLTMYMCSNVTTGKDWPDAKNTTEPGSVLLFANEDDLARTIRKRLNAHNADCSKVHAVDYVQMSKDSPPDMFNLDAHIHYLSELLDNIPDCRLIILDPITAYLGNVNANSNTEIRGVLIGLQNLAQERDIAVLAINHLSKNTDRNAIHRVLGSTAFVAAARAAWGVIFDKREDDSDDEPTRLLMPIKTNYSINPTSLSYQIIDGAVAFNDGESRVDIDAIIQGVEKKKKNPNIEKAKEFLQGELEGKAFVLARDIQHKAEQEGINSKQLYKAKDALGVLDWRDGFGGASKWALERVDE